MEDTMRGHFSKIKNMGMEEFNGLMVEFMKDSGRIIFRMVREDTRIDKESGWRENGHEVKK